MVEEPANVCVMQGLGGRGVPVSMCNLRIGHESFNQRLQVRILQSADEIPQGLPQFVNVLGGFRKVVSEVDFAVAQSTDFVNRELKAILVLVEETFDLEEVVLFKSVECILDVVPHLGFDLSAAITQDKSEIRFARLLGLHLLRHHHKGGSNDLIFLLGAVADEKFLHESIRFPKVWAA